MTTVLRHNRYPSMRIIDPDSGEVVQFRPIGETSGILVINEDDPSYETVMRVARADSSISIETTGIERCATCNEEFTGKMAKARLAKHQKELEHQGTETIGAQVQKGAQFVCPVDQQAFPSEGALVAHTRDSHAPKAPDDVDDEPQTRPGAVMSGSMTIPAARPTGG